MSLDLIDEGIDFLNEVVMDMSLHWLSPQSEELHHRTNLVKTGHEQPLASIFRNGWGCRPLTGNETTKRRVSREVARNHAQGPKGESRLTQPTAPERGLNVSARAAHSSLGLSSFNANSGSERVMGRTSKSRKAPG